MKLPTYGNWADVPDNLKTKTGLSKVGLKLSPAQQPAAIKTHWDYKIDDYNLYDADQAIPKRKLPEKQRERNIANLLLAKTCKKCGVVQRSHQDLTEKLKLCRNCYYDLKTNKAKNQVIEWSQRVLAEGTALILDTETTGLNADRDDEVIQLGVIDLAGNVLFDSLFKPSVKISPGAAAVHGLSEKSLQSAPLFRDCYGAIVDLLKDRQVLIFNSDFDEGIIRTTVEIYDLPHPPWLTKEYGYLYADNWDCVMHRFAAFYGEWRDFPHDFRWQSLATACDMFGIETKGLHGAVNDCQAPLRVIQGMAQSKKAVSA